MSGFEAAGVVLAILPLVIEAVKGYQEGLDPLTTLLYPGKYRRELRSIDRRIRIQRDLYECSLSRMLSPQFTGQEIQDLLSQPNGILWQRPEIVRKCRQALCTTHTGCIIVIEDIRKTVEELLETLKKGRLSFSFHKDKREQLIKNLQINNESLLAFVGHRENGGGIMWSKSDPTNLVLIKNLREKVSSLYESLAKSFNCQTDFNHVVSLHLPETLPSTKQPTFKFRLLFALSSMSFDGDAQEHWKRQEVEVKETEPFKSDMTPVKDICATIKRLHISQGLESLPSNITNCLISSQKNVRFMIDPLPRSGSQTGDPATSVRLSKVLGRSQILSAVFKDHWYRCHRSKIALTLAQAVLQLSQSPWLDSEWTADDVYLLSSSPEQNATPANALRPLVSRSFRSPKADAELNVSETCRNAPWIRSQEFYSLAIVLIELAFDSPLQSKRTEKDSQDIEVSPGGYREFLIDYATAKRLIHHDLICEMGSEYARIVRRCFYGFDSDNHDLNSVEFHSLVHEGVLEPLENNLKMRAPPGW